MLIDRVEALENDMQIIKQILPEWIPLNKEFATSKGFKSTNGLRRWCLKNLSPHEFEQKGRKWYVHKTALAKISLKMVKFSSL